MSEILVAQLAVALAGFVYGCTGFGFGLVAIPILGLLFEPVFTVPLVGVVSLPLTLALFVSLRAEMEKRLLIPLVAGAVLAMPLGVLFLSRLPATTTQRVVGMVISLSALVILSGWQRPLDHHRRRWPALVGACAGLLGTGAGLPGPPVLLFLANQGEAKAVFRSTLVGFFLCTTIASILGYLAAGMLGGDLWIRAGGLLPASIAGAFAGSRVARHLDDEIFRRLVLLLALVAGVALTLAAG